MEPEKIKTPAWFWTVAIFFLLWNLMGILSFFAHTIISEEALELLPANERALYSEYPMWISIVFAIAVFSGFIANIGLVFKRKWSKMAFIISLIAIVIQMTHNVFFTNTIEVYGTGQAVTMPAILIVFGAFLVWFSNLGTQKGWLK